MREAIQELRDARDVITDRELSQRLASHAPANGGGPDARVFAEAALRFSRALGRIESWGVVVRDLDTGLCDFRSRRGGRDVYLCWLVHEEDITWWHELDAGFAGRTPLDAAPPEDRDQPGR
jgi:hypothetical protein